MAEKRVWVLRNPKVLANCIAALTEAEGEERIYKVTLQRYSKPRTIEQNRTLHMWFREIAEHTGYTEEQIKTEMKERLGPSREEVMILGEWRSVQPSTADYTLAYMILFMERIQEFCAEWDIEITDPDPSIHHPLRV